MLDRTPLPADWWRRSKSKAAAEERMDAGLADGYTPTQVARAMGVHETTVRRRRAAVWGGTYGPLPGQPLTRAQLRVLARLLAIDEPTQEQAASDLKISLAALQNSLSRSYKKLAVRSLVGAQRVLVIEQDRRLPNWRRV